VRILIINTNGGSIYHGPNLRTYYAANELVKRGHDVVIATSAYSHKYGTLPKVSGAVTAETIDGIEYRWVKALHYRGLIQRVLHNLQFGLGIIRHRKKICTQADVVVFSGPPLELFPFAWLMALFLQCPIVSDIRDLWPLTQLEMSRWHWLSPYTYLQYCCLWFMARRSAKCLSPLAGAAQYINKFAKKAKVIVIPNGCDTSRPINNSPMELRVVKPAQGLPQEGESISTAALAASDTFIVGYSGSFDRDNDTASFVRAATALATRSDILFLMVGSGCRRSEIATMAADLPNLLICDRVPSLAVRQVLSAMDVCYCGLSDKRINMYGVSLAKSYEYMAAGKPILWMIDACNNLVAESGGGIVVPPEDHEALARAIADLAKRSPGERSTMGALGKDYLNKHFAYDVLGKQWEHALSFANPNSEATRSHAQVDQSDTLAS